LQAQVTTPTLRGEYRREVFMNRVLIFILAVMLAGMTLLATGCTHKPTQAELQTELEKAQVESNTEGAIGVYGKIVQYYPESAEAAKAQFMIGYLYSNELNDTSKAREAFETFLDLYAAVSDSQLVLSAKMELQTMGMGVDAYEKMLFEDKGKTEESGKTQGDKEKSE
jgi:outer membrane protein assembly factor BamD (BamD/ComL family)